MRLWEDWKTKYSAKINVNKVFEQRSDGFIGCIDLEQGVSEWYEKAGMSGVKIKMFIVQVSLRQESSLWMFNVNVKGVALDEIGDLRRKALYGKIISLSNPVSHLL